MTNEKELTHIDLFSGIGGFTLAAEWAGFKTIVFCEKEKFCQKVLQKRFGAVIADSKSREAQSTEAGRFYPESCGANRKPIIIPEIRDFEGTKWRGATLLTGGFPCQPFSVAGQQRGKEDDRYLWPEMLRVISEAKPHWILAENVPGIFRMALDTVLADLESKGYSTGTFIIPACGINAPHRRNRVWIVAHTRKQERNWLSSIGRQKMAEIGNKDQNAQNAIGTGAGNKDGKIDDQKRRASQDRRESIRQEDRTIGTSRSASTNSHVANSTNDGGQELCRNMEKTERQKSQARHQSPNGPLNSNSHASNAKCLGWQEGARKGIEHEKQVSERQDIGNSDSKGTWKEDWYEVATRFCRVDDGVPDRIHRLKALGNAIVPQVAYEILKNIAWIENERATD